MRHFFLQARRGKNDDAKRQVMPIVRSLVQKVVIGKTQGHQPATLEVHGLISSILAQMDVLDLMERRFVAEVHADFIEKLEAGEIETKEKQKSSSTHMRRSFVANTPSGRICKCRWLRGHD